MPHRVWIVIANGSRARLLQRTAPGEPLTELQDWTHPATRLHPQDLGGPHSQSGIAGRTGLAQRSTPHEHEREAFAKEISEQLMEAVNAHKVGSIALLASNPFLGDLMSHAHGQLQKHLCATHDVDLTSLSLPELEQRLHDEFRL